MAGHASLLAHSEDGKSWGELLMDCVQNTADSISGTPVRDWVVLITGMQVDDYVRAMRVAAGRDTWGGFLEVSLLWTAWSGRTGTEGHVILFEHSTG